MLEAVYFGIPVLMLRSGLPMEDWVPGLIRQQELGRSCTEVEELIEILDGWLDDPARIRRHKAAARSYAGARLDQQQVTDRIGQVVSGLLAPALIPDGKRDDANL